MHILATLCYLQKPGCTLMLHRDTRPNDYHYGKWNGVGGKLESGEDPFTCARREIFEETGFTVKHLTMNGFLSFPNFDGINDWQVFVFTARGISGTMCSGPEGHLEWVKNNDLLTLNLWEGDRIFLPHIFGRRFFTGVFTYTDRKLANWRLGFGRLPGE